MHVDRLVEFGFWPKRLRNPTLARHIMEVTGHGINTTLSLHLIKLDTFVGVAFNPITMAYMLSQREMW